ncbi:SDR family NAD(P)-dependent oxidoreductase [Novosphingobium album (ex Liu et al. 2023)]|uniref:SDR family NAD(P)-dependent oxidoreductase n=1 Tax=Novosphingobium album (ex Liu et al. 2023) TaxID=3031130 RepID=A0ABT5WXS5_9SPHN|nr:SDR family NAD(P)-dependent oxidoreductase [Novosphingobium album (ex Liu et al. 2023)]MDE8654533.1 SDR family NAD(P)-dependent oxidoreductase [Novosphingobium album (ex Liu et al. 2023)]
MGALSEKVALVTGASRGIGKGIACALADQGATVYVTGRTVSPGEHPLPGTLAETVAAVNARGGRGVAVPMDLAEDEQIAAVFDRIRGDEGQLDILVNNAMAIPDAMTQRVGFWEKPLSEWEIFDTGVRAAFIAAWHAARIMVPQGSGLIAALSGYVGVTYTYDVVFGTTKTATDRMMRDMAVELNGTGVTALSLWQGFTYTERAMENLKTVPGMASQLNSAVGSSPEFPGRVIAALACDANLAAKSGGTFINAELAAEYGLTDIDGRVIPSLRETRGAPLWAPGATTWNAS